MHFMRFVFHEVDQLNTFVKQQFYLDWPFTDRIENITWIDWFSSASGFNAAFNFVAATRP